MEREMSFFEILRILFVVSLIAINVVILFHKYTCHKKGWASADVNGCYDAIGKERVRQK